MTKKRKVLRAWMLRVLTSSVLGAGLVLAAMLALHLPGSPIARADTAAITAISVPTTWTTGSTHIITSSLSVQAKLTIQPGVEVRFDQGADIQVSNNGVLEAIGSPTQPITFTSNQTQTRGVWNGIHFDGNSISGTIRYAVIEYANIGLELFPPITSTTVSPRFDVASNTLRYLGDPASPSNSGAIIGSPDNTDLKYNTIYSATRGIVLQKPGSVQVVGNTIYNIDDGCVVFESAAAGSVNNTIANNTIYNCSSNGIRIDDLSGTGNQIISNVISNTAGGAIYLNNQTGLVITDNVVYGVPVSGGSGLVFNWNQGFAPAETINNNAFCVDGQYEVDAAGSSQTLTVAGNWLGTNAPAVGTEINGSVNYTPTIQLTVVPTPAALPADGVSTAVITISMNDGAGHTVPSLLRTINLTTTLGTLSAPSVILDGVGVATLTITAPFTYGTAVISATEPCNFTANGALDFQAADVAISKVANMSSVLPGDALTYTLTFANEGNFTATAVIVTETVPANTTFQGPAGVWTAVGGGVYTYAIANLGPGINGQLAFAVLVNDPLPTGTIGITNTAQITTTSLEVDPSDNSFTLFTPVGPHTFYLPIIFKNFSIIPPPPPPTPTPVPLPYVSDVTVDPNTNQVFVASPREDGVHVIDGATNQVYQTVWVGNGPTGLTVLTSTVIDPGQPGTLQFVNDKVFVAHQYGDNFWHPGLKAFGVQETASHNTFDNGYVGAAPVKVAANSNNGRVYVSNYYDKLAVLDGWSNQPETRLGWVEQKGWQGAYGIAVSRNTNRVYLATQDTGELVVFDGNGDRLLQTGYIPTHIKPPAACSLFTVAVNEATGHVFVPCPQLGSVFVLDENQVTLLRLAELGTLEKRPDGWARVVSATAAPWIATINVPGGVGLGEEGIAVDTVTNLVFITHAAQNRVYILQDGDSGSLLLPAQSLTTGFNYPQGIAVNPLTHRLYVGNAGNNTLTALEGTTPFTTVAIINLP